jgi:hypothetical protein
MYINFNTLNFYKYLFFNVSFFKVNALEPEFAFFIFFAKRGGLVTEGTFYEMCFEGCNEMKKVSSCHKDMSKLSVSQSKLGLTRVNSCFNTGSTLPQRDNNKLRECIISFSDPGFRREDSGLSIHTCTKKNLIILRESVFLTPDCIIIKCGNSGKHCSLNAIFLNYSYLNIFHILNILLSLKRFFFAFKVFDVLDLNQSTSRRCLYCQEILCQNGGKKFEKANGLGNSWHTSIKKPNLFKFGNKLNSIYLNLNRKGYYRWYCAQNSFNNDRLNCTIREWPNNKILLRFKNEVIQEQIALVDLAKLKCLYSDVVKRRQTILLKSLKFRIIAVYKISQSNGAKTLGIDNISFIDDSYTNKKNIGVLLKN